MKKNQRIIITGGTGFIGSRLVERLVHEGSRPILFLREQSDKKRIQPFINNVEVVEVDLLHSERVRTLVNKIDPYGIFHLAGFGVNTYTNQEYSNSKYILQTNLDATINLLYAAKETGCQIFVNTGSCFEYGSNNKPFKETDPLYPCNIYGVSKVATTFICDIISNTSSMKIITLRPFTVYGPGEDSKRFIATAIESCLRGNDIKLTKEKIMRDYIFIDDVVDAYLIAFEKGEEFSGKVFNISTGKGVDLEYVAKLIKQLTAAGRVQILHGLFPNRSGEVYSLIGNPHEADTLLSWKAKYSLREGLMKTIEWHQNGSLNMSKSL